MPVCQYAPIAKALHSMDAGAQLTVKRKFDIAFVITKEHLPTVHEKLIRNPHSPLQTGKPGLSHQTKYVMHHWLHVQGLTLM